LEVCKLKDNTLQSYDEVMNDSSRRNKMSDDFENLCLFINDNCKKRTSQTSSSVAFNKKSMFKAFNKKMTLKETHPKRSVEKYKGRVVIINGLPECLKIFSPKKIEMLIDFNQVISQVLETQGSGLLVFIFSDNRERNKNFLNKIFNSTILESPDDVVKRMELNPVTSANITKILRKAVNDNGISLTNDAIDDIVKNSSQDVNNALLTLQLYSAGKMGNESSSSSRKSKRKKTGSKRTNELLASQIYTEDEFFKSETNNSSKRMKTSVKGKHNDNSKVISEEVKANSKDFGLSIFHALGKFLYNKRIDPNTKEARIMTSQELSVVPKPKSYIHHEHILNQVQTENNTFSLFLQENMYSFFNDIDDVVKVLDVY